MDYKIKTIYVNKSVKINVGNYESVGLDYGLEIEPSSEITNCDERDILINTISKEIDDIMGPQILKVRKWAQERVKSS
jgi:hypothetical protein